MATRSLDTLRPLTPCPLAAGFQEPVSHCKVCGRDVLDLSAYTREEAAALLSVAEPPCVRFALRDGKPVFREIVRAAIVTATLAGAIESAVRAVVEKPSIVRHVEAATASIVTGGVVAPHQAWR